MEPKYTVRIQQKIRRARSGLSVLALAVGWVCVIAGAARAQTCPSGACASDAECNDGLFCTIDTCINPGPSGGCLCFQRSCNDNLYCTEDSCNEDTDTCDHVLTNCPSPTPFCDEATDTCVECLQDTDCTVDPRRVCANGVCVECNDHGDCQNAFYCDGLESCNFTTGLCEAGTPVTCTKTCFLGPTPGAQCTTDANCGSGGRCLGFCSENRKGLCIQCESDAGCGDGKYCNGAESCSNNMCAAGTPPVCKKCVGGPTPGAICQVDSTCGVGGTCSGVCIGPTGSCCDEANDRCQVCLADGDCDDGVFCTTDDCTPLGSLKICNHIEDPERFCDDGVVCNGAEACTADNMGCEPGTPLTCQKICFHGTTPGATCASDANCGAGGRCVGLCSETFGGCVQCEFDTACNDGLFCNGSESCVNGQCTNGTPVNCSNLDVPPCAVGFCNENTDQCITQAQNNGMKCEDGNHCTASSKCSGGVCVNNPPASNDPYLCVRLEWRPSSLPQVTVGSTVTLSLYAVADGCNTTSEHCPANQHPVSSIEADITWDPTKLELIASTSGNPNPQDPCNNSNSCNQCQTCTGGSNPGTSCSQQCVGGANHGQVCFNTLHCPGGTCNSGPVCVGGSNNGNTCTSNGNCPGGTCNMSNKCLGGGTCSAPTAYNWASSLFPNDCISSQMNDPCPSVGFPGNDGDAYYQAIQPLSCSGLPAPPSCITTSGLPVTNIKFKVLPGSLGSTAVSLLPCGPDPRRTGVQSTLVPPCCTGGVCSTCQPGEVSPYSTDDVLKSLGPPATITVVACDDNGDCNDNNGCTLDSCSNGSCVNSPLNCQDADPCTMDACINGACTYTPIQCDAGEVCYQGDCYITCSAAAECDDGVDCTVDTCQTNLPPPPFPPPTGICHNTPDDDLCDTGLFCDAQRCDAIDGCIPDGFVPPNDLDCRSSDGNPCADPTLCDEATDTCGGCNVPAVVSGGSRYLLVTPANQGTTPVALRVIGECGDSQSACVDRYVQSKCIGGLNDGVNCQDDANCPKRCEGGTNRSCVGGTNPGVLCCPSGTCNPPAVLCTGGGICMGNPCTVPADCPLGICSGYCDEGTLGSIPFYKVPSQWGTAKIRGAQIRPGANYLIDTVCRFPAADVRSKSVPATTWSWGEVDGNGIVNVLDVNAVVACAKSQFGIASFEQCNVWACTPDKGIDVLDVAVTVDALKGVQFARPCPTLVCP